MYLCEQIASCRAPKLPGVIDLFERVDGSAVPSISSCSDIYLLGSIVSIRRPEHEFARRRVIVSDVVAGRAEVLKRVFDLLDQRLRGDTVIG